MTMQHRPENRLDRSLFLALVAVVGLAFASTATVEAGDDDYTLTISSASTSLEGSVDLEITLDSQSGDDLLGYQWGVCHEDALTLEEGDVVNGTALEDLGHTFQAVNVFVEDGGRGWNVGALFDVAMSVVLEPADDQLLFIATYTCGTEEVTATVEFCETLGDPPTTIRVIVGSEKLEPALVNGEVECGGVPPYILTCASVTEEQAATVDVPVTLDAPAAVDSFSFGLSFDDEFVDIADVVEGAALADFNDGEGASFFAVNMDPDGGPGITVGCIVSFGNPTGEDENPGDFEQIAIGDGQEIVVLSLDIDGQTPDESTIPLDFSADLGSPAVPLVISLDGESVSPQTIDGELFVMGVPLPPYLAGDMNSDGDVDISDPLYLALALFGDGDEELACEIAADLNDDEAVTIADAVALIDYLFQGGEPPADPYPDCAFFDSEVDPLSCDTANDAACSP